MRVLDRYVLREVLAPLLLSLALFTSLLFIGKVLKLVELVATRGVPISSVGLLLVYLLPNLLEMTLPIGLLFAILAGLGRLSVDSEITVLRAAGVSLPRLARPIALLSLACAATTMLLSVELRPWANRRLRETTYDVVRSRAAATIQPQVFVDQFKGLVIYVSEIEPPGNLLRGVMISGNVELEERTSASKDEQTTVLAREATIVPASDGDALRLHLTDGSIHKRQRADLEYQRTDFRQMDVRLDLSELLPKASRAGEPKEVGIAALIDQIWSARTAGQIFLPAEIELYRRMTIPFACLGLALLAVPLSVSRLATTWSGRLSTCVGVLVLYYAGTTLGEALALRGVSVALCLWAPNLVVTAIGAYLFMRITAHDQVSRAQ